MRLVFFNPVFSCSARTAVSVALHDVQRLARWSKNTSVKSASGFLSETETELAVATIIFNKRLKMRSTDYYYYLNDQLEDVLS